MLNDVLLKRFKIVNTTLLRKTYSADNLECRLTYRVLLNQ